jgi:hypothetical protein
VLNSVTLRACGARVTHAIAVVLEGGEARERVLVVRLAPIRTYPYTSLRNSLSLAWHGCCVSASNRRPVFLHLNNDRLVVVEGADRVAVGDQSVSLLAREVVNATQREPWTVVK